jgi:hypothetical protein
MLENILGTSTSSNYNSICTLSFAIFLYKLYTVANFKHLGYLTLLNYVCTVAFRLDLQRASFYSVLDFLSYSTTAIPLLLQILVKVSYSSLRTLL